MIAVVPSSHHFSLSKGQAHAHAVGVFRSCKILTNLCCDTARSRGRADSTDRSQILSIQRVYVCVCVCVIDRAVKCKQD
jgi:hypothetical protein